MQMKLFGITDVPAEFHKNLPTESKVVRGNRERQNCNIINFTFLLKQSRLKINNCEKVCRVEAKILYARKVCGKFSVVYGIQERNRYTQIYDCYK
jgi:hypothetical protein